MTITFVSNYINHHQAPFCGNLYEALGEDFCFIQTEPMSEERLQGGWAVDERMFSYVYFYDRDREICEKRFLESDIVLLGWSKLPARLIEQRLMSGKVTLRISERIYKEGRYKALSPRGLGAKYKEHIRYRKKPVYMLCADAYAAGDFRLIHSYPKKLLRWGYFPKTEVQVCKQWTHPAEETQLCWAGRMIDWKHPEFALRVAAKLKNEGYHFTLQMIGDGPLRPRLEQYAERHGLEGKVLFRSTMTPFEVRKVMGASRIYLFTSNFLEGWGAVVNEAMNAGCAVVASREGGSVPYLMTNGVNGLVYNNGRYDEFEACVLRLFHNPKTAERLGRAAANTILGTWNAETAAKRLLSFCEHLLQDGTPTLFHDAGPLSPAPIYKSPGILRRRGEPNRQDHQ